MASTSLVGRTAPHPAVRTHHPPTLPRRAHLAPSVALSVASVLLAISIFLPYWRLVLITTAQPGGLRLVSYLGHLDGPIEPVLAAAGVSSAVPLMSLSELERSLSLATGTVLCLLLVAAILVHNRWATLLALPALFFPVIVVADTARWLRPTVEGLAAAADTPIAALSPLLFGRLGMERMVLEIRPGAGLVLATLASLAVVAGIWFAYRPGSSNASDGETVAERGPR